MAATRNGHYQNGISSNSINRLATEQGFDKKTLFVTGGTGFMGKVLLEKMLRTCPGVTKIFLLIRNKKGKTSQERLDEIFSGPLFDVLKKTHGESIIKKVQVIPGDVMELELGISEEDRQLLANEVEIVFHVAATTRFDDPIKKSVLINTRGTKQMLDLAKEMKKLKVFCHVSTAYCHLDEKVLYEKTYDPPADPISVIKTVEWLSEEVIEANAAKILKTCPNPYVFSKALAEGLVNEAMSTLPVIICRPSVVVPIFKEPLPGWANNIFGPIGLLVAAGKGILRTMYCDSKGYADFIPMDILINVLMLATFDYMVYRTRRIYNCTTSLEIKVTWEELIEVGKRVIYNKMPFNGVVWYPGGSPKKQRWVHRISSVLFHYIPAVFLDMIIFLAGHTPVVWKIQRKLSKGFEMFEYFANNTWEFDNEQSLKARSLLNETERQIYKIDKNDVNLEDYLTDVIHATRLYVLNESDESLPSARRHMNIMWAVDKLVKFLLLLGFGYVLMNFVVYPIMGKSY